MQKPSLCQEDKSRRNPMISMKFPTHYLGLTENSGPLIFSTLASCSTLSMNSDHVSPLPGDNCYTPFGFSECPSELLSFSQLSTWGYSSSKPQHKYIGHPQKLSNLIPKFESCYILDLFSIYTERDILDPNDYNVIYTFICDPWIYNF